MQQIGGNNEGEMNHAAKRANACLLHLCAALYSEMRNGTILKKVRVWIGRINLSRTNILLHFQVDIGGV